MDASAALELVRRTRRVHGWLSVEAAMLIAWIDEIQKSDGVAGDVFEIGVHHGKSALLLAALLRPGRETLGVCDLFADQSRNLSASGAGDRQIFEANMKAHAGSDLQMRIFAKPSSALTREEIGANVRIFHIDGGHNVEEALNDLQLAAATTVDAGVIVLDDPFRADWPGVTHAAVRFLEENRAFCAVAVGFNKMILTRREVADRYAREIDAKDQRAAHNIIYPWQLKVLPFMGHPLRIFHVPSYLSLHSLRAKAIRYHHFNRWTHVPVLAPVVYLAKVSLGHYRRRVH